MKRTLFYYILFWAFTQALSAQNTKTISLHFAPVFENQKLELGKKYHSDYQHNIISFTVFKCYVSHFELYKDGKLLYTIADSYFLLDASNPDSLNRSLRVPNSMAYDEIRFYMGIDDKTNDNGIGPGDLDPTKGMYWTWQTGYINLKLEGFCPNSSAADKGFQFHLGGFLAPNSSFQTIALKPITNDATTINIEIDRFLETLSLQEVNTVMSPSEKSVRLSKSAALAFRLP